MTKLAATLLQGSNIIAWSGPAIQGGAAKGHGWLNQCVFQLGPVLREL